MSTELERAFAALSSDADRAGLAPPQTIRREGDRQRLTVALAGAAAVAVLVTGVSVGARLVAGPDRSPTVPAVTPGPVSPTPSAPSPSKSPKSVVPVAPEKSSPSTPAPPPEAPDIPDSIPARAFVQAADAPGEGSKPERQGAGDHDLPDFCGKSYEQRSATGIRATQVMFYKSAGSPADSTPKSALYEDVIVFRGDGAEKFMADLRAAVGDCPGETGDERNVSLGRIGVGDDSLLIERNNPAMTDEGIPVGDGSLHRVYFAAIRIGDSVAFLNDTGWESGSADRADTTHLARKAADRLAAWRD